MKKTPLYDALIDKENESNLFNAGEEYIRISSFTFWLTFPIRQCITRSNKFINLWNCFTMKIPVFMMHWLIRKVSQNFSNNLLLLLDLPTTQPHYETSDITDPTQRKQDQAKQPTSGPSRHLRGIKRSAGQVYAVS